MNNNLSESPINSTGLKVKQNSDSYARIAITDQIFLLRRIAKRISNERDQIIFRLFLETGCSTQELISIKPEDFEFTTSSIRLGQGKKQRLVKLPPDLSLQLNSFISKEKEYIFSSRESKQITVKRVSQIIKAHSLKLLKIKITPSYLRKTHIQFSFIRTKSADKTKEQAGIRNLTEKAYLLEEQIRDIRGQIGNSQHLIIFDLLYETGCILKEITSLKIHDFEFTTNSLVIEARNTKNNRKRISRISPELSLRIKEFVNESKLSGEDFLFSTRQSSQVSDKRIFQLIKDYAKKAGISGVSPQIVRNSSIINSMQSGKALSEIQEQTGVMHLNAYHFGLAKITKK